MKPLVLLIVVSGIVLLGMKVFHGTYDLPRAARIGMSAMLLFTALGHFMFADGMAMMIPDFFKFKKELVYFTAIVEIVAAIGLHVVAFRHLTGWLLIVFFILILPANIKSAIDQIDYQNATYNGPGLKYLWFRVPLQLLFIGWVYLSAIKNG